MMKRGGAGEKREGSPSERPPGEHTGPTIFRGPGEVKAEGYLTGEE